MKQIIKWRNTHLSGKQKRLPYILIPLSEPKKSSEAIVSSNTGRIIPAVSSVKLSPKFTLVATSYYRSKPQESMALVWEPGIGYHWIKRGTKLGHFIIDKIECGTVIYRNGNMQGEMSVDTKAPIYSERTHQAMSVSTGTRISPAGSSVLPERETMADDPGLPNQEAQPMTQENELGGIG